ncbi:hypothetical protein D920_02529 [Enterococcus faecalis 13-SD-W-01]|nr:hypothetical protein D920_02529 [Enterococcus faecalis 13-SD-W-01]
MLPHNSTFIIIPKQRTLCNNIDKFFSLTGRKEFAQFQKIWETAERRKAELPL